MTVSSTTDLEILARLRMRLAELTELANPTIIAADDHGLITYIDAPLARALGWSAEELVGRSLTTIIPRRFRDAHHIGFSRFLTTGEPRLLERTIALSVSTRGGEEMRVQHVITAVRVGPRWVFAASIRPEVAGARG